MTVPCHTVRGMRAEFVASEVDGVIEVCDAIVDATDVDGTLVGDTEVDMLADDMDVAGKLVDETVVSAAVVIGAVLCCAPRSEAT